MAINFPDSPTLNQTFQQADRAWQWDGEKWKATGTTSSSTVGATVVFEGATDDVYETTLTATDPTADRTITLPNASGTVAFTSDLSPYLTTATASSTYAPKASPEFTGNVTMQSLDMDDIVAGDVIYGSGADTLARLAKGSNDQVLTLASGVPSWATPAGGDSDKIEDADADTKIQVEESSDEDKIRFDTGGTERAVLDSSGLEIKSGGLKLNDLDSSDVNTLDDYEEGTFTGSFTCQNGTITAKTDYRTGGYTKVGRVVHIQFSLAVDSFNGNSGELYVEGLPFTSMPAGASTSLTYARIPVTVTNLNVDVGNGASGQIPHNMTQCSVSSSDCTSSHRPIGGDVKAWTEVCIQGHYFVDS